MGVVFSVNVLVVHHQRAGGEAQRQELTGARARRSRARSPWLFPAHEIVVDRKAAAATAARPAINPEKLRRHRRRVDARHLRLRLGSASSRRVKLGLRCRRRCRRDRLRCEIIRCGRLCGLRCGRWRSRSRRVGQVIGLSPGSTACRSPVRMIIPGSSTLVPNNGHDREASI
jgi:hypothetical protein